MSKNESLFVKPFVRRLRHLNWMWQFTSEWFNNDLHRIHSARVSWMKPKAFTGKYMFSRSHTGVKYVPFSWSQHKNLTSFGSLKQAWRLRQLLSLSQIPPSPNCYPCGPAPPAGGPVPDPGGAITQICWAGVVKTDWIIWKNHAVRHLLCISVQTGQCIYDTFVLVLCSSAIYISPILVYLLFIWQNYMSCTDSFMVARIKDFCHMSLQPS